MLRIPVLPRIPGIPRLPLGGGPGLLAVGAAAYIAADHDKGKHTRPHPLCAVCWLNKVAPPRPAS